MKISMDLEQAIRTASSALRAGLTVQVTPCTYNPNEYRVKADGINMEPVEEAKEVQARAYAMQWGRNTDGQYWVRFNHDGDSVEISRRSSQWTGALVEQVEEDFCQSHYLVNAGLYESLDWTPWPGAECFHKAATSGTATDVVPRLCHFGCGRVLRGHERRCPDCVPSYEELYNTVGGC